MRVENFWTKHQFLLVALGTTLLLLVFELAGVNKLIVRGVEFSLKPANTVSHQLITLLRIPYFSVIKSHRAALQVQNLEARFSECLAQTGEMQALRDENQTLRQLLENSDRSLTPLVIAAPIVSYGIPLIDRGEQDGVSIGDVVLGSGWLIGLVEKVTPYQANIALLTSLNSPPVLVKTESQVTGLIRGNGKQIMLEEIPKDLELKAGEKILTLGQEGIPPNILVGKIQTLIKNDTAPTQTAVIEQVVSFYELQLVEIRKPS